MIKKLIPALAAVGASAFACAQAATLVFEDEVDVVDGVPQIDFFSFTVTAESVVTLGVDAETAGFMGSDLDAFLLIANDDGDRTRDDILATSDDENGTDPFITITLPAGSYLAAVSNCCISRDEFVQGENGTIGIKFNNGAYRLTIEGAVAMDAQAVPLPSAALLFAPALVGGLAARRRRG